MYKFIVEFYYKKRLEEQREVWAYDEESAVEKARMLTLLQAWDIVDAHKARYPTE